MFHAELELGGSGAEPPQRVCNVCVCEYGAGVCGVCTHVCVSVFPCCVSARERTWGSCARTLTHGVHIPSILSQPT